MKAGKLKKELIDFSFLFPALIVFLFVILIPLLRESDIRPQTGMDCRRHGIL